MWMTLSLRRLTVLQTKEIKEDAISIFVHGGFQIHKWPTNAGTRLSRTTFRERGHLSQAPTGLRLGGGEQLLALGWDKVEDALSVSFPKENDDPLSLFSPTLLE